MADAVLRTEVLATEDAETWLDCAARGFTVLARPSGRLLAAVIVVAFVEAEPVDPAEGGRGGRSEFAEAREVTVDFPRACAVVRGESGLLVVGEGGFFVIVLDEGRADKGGNT